MYTIIDKDVLSCTLNGTSKFYVKITADTVADIPEPSNDWAAGSEVEVLENGGSKYKLTNSREWAKVNFKTVAGGGDSSELSAQVEQNKTDISLLKENVEFTPRSIGTYNLSWFIEGQGYINASLTQLQKNVFSLVVNGAGASYTPNVSYNCELNIPVKCYEINDSYSSPVVFGLSQGTGMGFIGFINNVLQFYFFSNENIVAILEANIIIYGELIEDETAE